MNALEVYNYYYIELADGGYVYKGRTRVADIDLARKFATKVQAVGYGRKYYEDNEFTVIGGGGLKEILPYEY